MFDLQTFREPGAEYRVHPFWFWNGEMEDGQIRLQIGEMAEKGVGGFFLCARQGMTIPYLSETWLKKVRVAVEAAREHQMNVWLYDEYPYPSGIAGGEVILEHPEAKHYSLVYRTERVSGGQHLTLDLPWARVLYAKAVPVDGEGGHRWSGALDVRPWIGNFQAEPVFQQVGLTAYNQKRFFSYGPVQRMDWEVPEGQWEVMIVQEEEIKDFKYYGTFVDPCNKEAMATFIRLTHDKYAEHLSEFFGSTIKGMFTDEIGLLGDIPWSPRLAEFFQKQNGYDLRGRLEALLFADAEDAAKVRYDYFQAVHLLLLESYHKQVHDWCEGWGLEYITEVPSVRATTQLYSHVPGGDSAHEKLGRSLDWILDKNIGYFRRDPKVVSSIARQLGRKRNLIECFHSVGWSMTLQDAKWMIDRMAAMGTNFFNFHAFFYTLDGLTKHDAPPSQFLQNPYWAYFRRLADYIGRISYVMSEGEMDISIAVLQPTTTFWTQMGNPLHGFAYCGQQPGEKERLAELIRWWGSICSSLTKRGRDYDHLDAGLLAQGEVADGKLVLGDAKYSVLVLPPLTNLEEEAWAKIKLFLEAGGRVVSLGQLPYERISTGAPGAAEVQAVFGLSGGGPNGGFQGGAANGMDAAAGAPVWQWSKGAKEAYHLPFPASADTEAAAEQLAELLNKLEPASVELLPGLKDTGLMLQTRRLSPGQALVFISNQEETEREMTLQISASLWEGAEDSGAGQEVQFRFLSLTDGSVKEAAGKRCGDKWMLPVKLSAYDSCLVMLELAPAAEGGQAGGMTEEEPWRLAVDAAGPWRLKPLQDNAVRLDIFRLRVNGAGADEQASLLEAEQVPVRPIIDQCAELAADMSLPVNMHREFGTPQKLVLAYPLTANYSVEVELAGLPDTVRIIMDQGAVSGEWTMQVNGHVLKAADLRPCFLYDHMNRGCDITPYLREGANTIGIQVELRQDWNGLVDAIYLVGSFDAAFAGEGHVVLERPVERLCPLQAGPYPGHPYYAGIMSFTRTLPLSHPPQAGTFELVLSGLDPEFHETAEVLVNGQSLGPCAWMPYRWSGAAGLLKDGDNEIEVRVATTLIGLLEGKAFHYASHTLRPVVLPHE